jgi:hypothetical protein
MQAITTWSIAYVTLCSLKRRKQLVELKYHAGFVDVDIDFMLRRPAPEDACEIKHGQQRKQDQHNGKDHHCAASPAIRVNVLLYDSICHRSILR